MLPAKIRGKEVTPETIPFALFNQFNQFNQQVQALVLGSLKQSTLEDAHGVIEEGSYKLVFTALPVVILTPNHSF